jgi:hypothetical protein
MASMQNDPTTMTPVEIDTVLYENYEQQMRKQIDIGYKVAEIERYDRKLAIAMAAPADLTTSAKVARLREQISTLRDELAELQQQLRDLGAATAPYQVEYINRPWNRYFLVKNVNGHVHRGMDCSTCFDSTMYAWLVELADCDEDAMVEEWGERACTVCFPSAPTNPLFNRPARIDREAQEARDAEKATKAAAKAEKAITDVDGSELRLGGRYGDVIKTKIAARNALSGQVQDAVWYGPDAQRVANIRKLALALEAAGMDWLKVVNTAFKKATKEATKPVENRFGLTPEQIAETQADIARNIEATREVLEDLINIVGREVID